MQARQGREIKFRDEEEKSHFKVNWSIYSSRAFRLFEVVDFLSLKPFSIYFFVNKEGCGMSLVTGILL